MGWGSAVRKQPAVQVQAAYPAKIDWAHLVSLDFETKYDEDYTLRKLSTSEYVRDPRFEALMAGVKIGNRPTKLIPGPKVKAELQRIDWSKYDLLAHHAQFDALILSHHYDIKPRKIYCTLSMARGLHNNDIGAGLDEVSQFYGGAGKLASGTEDFKGLGFKELFADKPKWQRASNYCVNDVDEMYRIFGLMVPQMPSDEMDIIDITVKLFTDPVLRVDLPRVQAELTRELDNRKDLLLSIIGKPAAVKARLTQIIDDPKLMKKKKYAGWSAEEVLLEEARSMISRNESFADLLRAEGVDPPVKVSPTTGEQVYAFAKTDAEFTSLSEHLSARVRALVEARLMVKSTLTETRAERFLKAGEGGMALPVYLRYYGAHTGRWSAGNKMNMQNLPRGGELRKSILAPKGHSIVVADSGQIEARVNAWLWGQNDLVEDFRKADRKEDRDVYCKFADIVYGRTITKQDDLERFVGKVGILGLGYQMGAPKLQTTLALGTMGPAVFLDLNECQRIVSTYRAKNHKIRDGWRICSVIIADMAAGRAGSHGPISWAKETIFLPNGMRLKYPNLRRFNTGEFDEWRYERKGELVKIYGGLLCENIVQALARIIVGWQLLQIAKLYRVVMTTHDEVAAVVKTAQAQKAYDKMIQIMRTPLGWCETLPLNAEGKHDVFYAK